MHQTVLERPLGYRNLWEFDLLEEGGERGCSTPESLLRYLCSSDTKGLCVERADFTGRYLDVVVFGPMCDRPDFARCMYPYVTGRIRHEDWAALSPENKQHVLNTVRKLIRRDHVEKRFNSRYTIGEVLAALTTPRIKEEA